eukprot:CAMPEP_0201523136 /NCGR_PEP_ID=MMETSP0161_2-20130828/18761_1 /ASSEMBLY_ACC=CAM_ASM_000251 /TAXON_ID=180227 /ORGANISM="Neoparamoeba aestuarina, Strain SoJaBio B1-5/56/2" /LENGTH=286 /DNA_ID=CAMNT_0047922141 /DNA_START=101 /DNA_END=961 /DNA_ORIENTATION=+
MSSSQSTQAQRIDVCAILKEIKTVLDTRYGNMYMDVLRRFFMGKMPKADFDATCHQLLGKHLYLHNWFLMSLLNNSQTTLPLITKADQAEERTEGGKKKRKAGFTDFPRKKRKLDGEELEAGPHKQSFSSLAERCPKYSSLLVPASQISQNEHERLLFERSRIKWAPPLAPLKIERPSDLDAKMRTPAHFAIYERMSRISQENAVKEVSKDAVSLLYDALEIHLKNILSHAKPFLRRTQGNVYAPATLKERTDVIYPKDLLVVALLYPALFGDNLSVALSHLKFAK